MTPRKTATEMVAGAKPSPGGRRATATTRAKAAEAAAPQSEPGEAQTVGEALTAAIMGKASDGPALAVPYIDGIPVPTVIQAYTAVMREVVAVGKDDYNTQQKFHFRGVDAVINAVGPACRKHGIVVVPRKVKQHSADQYTTVSGTRMTNRVVHIRYRVYGPKGDYFDGEAFGESADAGDKSMSKAQSVAERVFLLQSGLIPTGDPDPDSESHERSADDGGSAPVNAGLAQRKREEWEATQAAKQDQQRQAQAGEENQDAPRRPPAPTEPPQQASAALDEARKHMWRTAKGLGWSWDKLRSRFQSDHGMPSDQADVGTVQAFTAVILKEAEAEEDRAKALVRDELGGKEVEPEQFPDSTPGSERLL